MKHKRSFQQKIDRFKDAFIQDVDANEVILFESILKPKGPVYKVVGIRPEMHLEDQRSEREFDLAVLGTGLVFGLIVVGVSLDTVSQIETHLITRHYDGLTGPKGPRIRGRGRRG